MRLLIYVGNGVCHSLQHTRQVLTSCVSLTLSWLSGGVASSPDGVGTHLVLPTPSIVQEARLKAEALSSRVDSETAGVGGTGQINIRSTGICKSKQLEGSKLSA